MNEILDKNEELKQKITQTRQKAYEAECRRIEQEVEHQVFQIARKKLYEEDNLKQIKLMEADAERHKAEQEVYSREQDLVKRIIEERRNKEESRKRAEEEKRRREEEELRKRKEEERRRAEEEERKRLEEEKRRREEEHRLAAEKKRQEEENQKKYIRELIVNAEHFYDIGDYSSASVEVAKILINDPTNHDALLLQEKIKAKTVEVVVDNQKQPPLMEETKTTPERAPAKNRAPYLITGFSILFAFVVIIILIYPKIFISPEQNLIVKPWISINNDQEELFVGSSIAEEVVNRLSFIPKFNIMGYSSAAAISGFHNNPTAEFSSLGYKSYLEGTVSKMNGELSINIRIVDKSNFEIWSNQYTITSDRLSEVAVKIVNDLIATLRIDIDPNVSSIVSRRIDVRPKAYENYLKGLELVHRQKPDYLRSAYELFKQAIREDDRFADAYTAASSVYLTIGERTQSINMEIMDEAEMLAKNAISLDKFQAKAHIVLARIYLIKRAYRDALMECEKAFEKAPNNAEVFTARAKIFCQLGEYEKALENANRAYRISPRDIDVLKTVADINQLLGRTTEAFQYHELLLNIVDNPNEYLRGTFTNVIFLDPNLRYTHGKRIVEAWKRYIMDNPKDYFMRYQYARILQLTLQFATADSILKLNKNLLQQELGKNSQDPLIGIYLALILTGLGEYQSAIDTVKRYMEFAKDNPVVYYKVAQLYAIQKRKEDALLFLKKAVALKYDINEILNIDFFNIREEKEFRSAIRIPLH